MSTTVSALVAELEEKLRMVATELEELQKVPPEPTERTCEKCGQTMRGPFYCGGKQLHDDGCMPTPEHDFCQKGEHLSWQCPCGWRTWERPKQKQPAAQPEATASPAPAPPMNEEDRRVLMDILTSGMLPAEEFQRRAAKAIVVLSGLALRRG